MHAVLVVTIIACMRVESTAGAAQAIFSDSTCFLKSHTGKHLDVENQMVHARWNSREAWQSLVVEKVGGGSIQSGDAIYLKSHLGFFVDVQDAAVQARWGEKGAWQKLIIEKPAGGNIYPGDTVCLLAHTGRHIDVQGNRVQARWHDCGTWQKFVVEQDVPGATIGGSTVFLRTHLGNHVDVESTSVKSRWQDRGLWQEFAMETSSGNTIFPGDIVFLKSHMGTHLDVEGNSVQARWHARGSWQALIVGKDSPGPIFSGDQVYFKAHSGNYVEVQGDDGGQLRARWSTPGAWQSFAIELKSSQPSTSTFLSTRPITATTTASTTTPSSVWTDVGRGCCHGTYMDAASGAAADLQGCKDKCSAAENCGGVAYGYTSGNWCSLYSGQVFDVYTDANFCSTSTHSSLRCYKSSGLPIDTKTCTNTNGAGADVLCMGERTKAVNFEAASCADIACPTNDAGCCVELNSTWHSAMWTAYESWPRCCAGNPNYDPTANPDECTLYNGCTWAGYFAYKSCSGSESTGNPGQCTMEFVQKNNLVSFFSTSGEHEQYRGKKIRIQAKGKTIEALVVDTCSDSDCPLIPPGCCTTNARKSKDGFLIDMERETVLKYWPEFTDPASQVHSTDIRWQSI